MKTVLIMRHAKSDWSDGGALDDHERPLNKRGKRQAKVMALFLHHCGCSPQKVISSTAVRAASTAKVIADEFGVTVQENKQLYLADTAMVVKHIGSIEDSCDVVLIVGHNPTMTELVGNFIAELDASIRFPTAAIACLNFDIGSWAKIASTEGCLEWLVIPGIIEKLVSVKSD